MTIHIGRDKQPRTDLRITFRVSIGDLSSYLASTLRHVTDPERYTEILNSLSPRQTRDQIRESIERHGVDHIDGWSDQYGYDETVQRLALAEQHVRRAYPDLDKADLEQKQQTAPAQVPAASEPEQTEETLSPAACRHGNTPRQDVTGDPIKACDDGFNAPGYVEFGAFNPEGCFYSGDGCAVDAANAAAEESEGEEDITWGRMCSDHNGEPDSHCAECNAEPAPTCADCSGAGCHWCHWTGKRR